MTGARTGSRYRFPWSPRAIAYAVKLATLHERPPGDEELPGFQPIPYRVIAAELFSRGFTKEPPSAKTVWRLVRREIGEGRAAR